MKVSVESAGPFPNVERPKVPEVDALLGEVIEVLPHANGEGGFVRVVDYMGDDSSIVQAARVSYGKGTKAVQDDRNLIRYLMRHRHSTPFEMAEIKLHVRAPMDLWRQWIRHRTASVNEYSTRYSEAIDASHYTMPGEWRRQSATNKQGSGDGDLEMTGEELSDLEKVAIGGAREAYRDMLRAGVAREQARKVLTLSTFTEAYWKIDLHNLLHFLGLRFDGHAQKEIRAYAEAITRIVEKWVPITWEAFRDYRIESVTLTGPEARFLRIMFQGEEKVPHHVVENWNVTKRERDEFRAKLERIGMMRGEP